MKSFGFLAICLLQITVGVFGEGYYSVIAPGTLHSARKYNVAVAVHSTTDPCQLIVGITGPSYNATKTVELSEADEVKLLEFDVPELEKGEYNLTAEGVAGVEFKNSTKLSYAKFEPYVHIQTDKGTYKPGDVLQYRIIFLDENLKPSTIEKTARVWFEDSKRNRVKEIKDLKLVKGVYTGKFEISEFPVLGNWRIMVHSGQKGFSQQVSFQVDKYVLPKYVVKMEANERVSVLDGDMQAVVRANYTYGKPVNGKVTLLIEVIKNYWHGDDGKDEPEIPAIIKVADMVNGKAKFDFSVKEYEKQINQKYASPLQITATVEEEFTGVKLNTTTRSTLFPYRYQMMCETYETCSTYHADKEAEVAFKILHVDGSLLKDTKSIVRLKYVEAFRDITWWDPSQGEKPEKLELPPVEERKHFEFEGHLNDSSIAVIKVTLPNLEEIKGYQHYFEGTIEYAGEKNEIISAFPYREPKEGDLPVVTNDEPKEYLKVEVQYEKDKYSINEGVESKVTVNSSKPLSYFVYTIVGRGNVLKIERVELPEPQKISTFTFVPTFQMAPYGKIYVHYVQDGEYEYAETTFYVDWEFKNKITIEAPEEVKVGEDVELTIKTAPNSFVGLLGVDQSVLLLRANNDIQEDQVKWRLGQYSTYTPQQAGFSRYPGEISGVVTLTNAHFFYNLTKPEWYGEYSTTPGMPIMLKGGGVRETSSHKTSAFGASNTQGGAAAAAPPAAAPSPTVRKDFAETWFFANIENTETESFKWVKKIPDTITSWVVSGFSLNPEKGIATTKESTKIRTFQPFFVSIRLPYSVKRGEVISVPALVFNYLEKDLDVEVTLENPDNEFEFTEVTNEVIDVEKRSKTIRVPSNSARGVSFMIRPKVVGNMLLKFTALSPVAGDALHKTLKVVPEGITEYVNRAFFVNLKEMPETTDTFELELPKEIVPDSEHAEFSVVGDLLGPLLNNLDYLVRLPTGCGEQTMSKFVPNYLMLRYLKSVKKLNTALESRIKLNLERGYQNMLRFQHTDGSFSSFGPATKPDEHPRNGSTWLTAYVMRFLQQSADYVAIDTKVIDAGIKYLATQQAANGSFTEAGDFFYASQRNEISLTASVVLALLEKQKTSPAYDTQIEKGLQFIVDNMDKAEELRIKSLAIYTLQQAKQAMAEQKLADFQTLAKTDSDRRWWSSNESNKPSPYPFVCCWWRFPRSDEVETTSYALLTILDQNAESEHVLPIVKWLVAQRNNYGGFSSTQDTVVGLQALIKFAEQSGYEAAEMTVQFKAKSDEREKSEELKINEENGLLMQTYELPAKTRTIEFQAQGKGAALMQVSYQYNVFEKDPAPSFTLNTIINKETPVHKLEMDVCVEYVGKDGESNMAVMEVSLPSGYVADVDSFEELRKVERVRQIESKNGDTTIVFYFESLKKEHAVCLPIEAYKAHPVALQKPAPIVVYDYYDTSKKATSFYEVVSKICEICDKEEEECQKVCA